jgi:hypothetical protein
MHIELIPLISFVIITTFTPGPNNICGASMGVMLGYRKTVLKPWKNSTVKANQDAEFVLFSPQHKHPLVFDHINRKLGT